MVSDLAIPKGLGAGTVAEAAAGDADALARIVATHHDGRRSHRDHRRPPDHDLGGDTAVMGAHAHQQRAVVGS